MGILKKRVMLGTEYILERLNHNQHSCMTLTTFDKSCRVDDAVTLYTPLHSYYYYYYYLSRSNVHMSGREVLLG